jgi:membrane-associated phospholipid phosphatase
VLVGEHYPLDVLGGWAFGALFAWISRPIFRFLAGLS